MTAAVDETPEPSFAVMTETGRASKTGAGAFRAPSAPVRSLGRTHGWRERLYDSHSERVEIARIPLPVKHPVAV